MIQIFMTQKPSHSHFVIAEPPHETRLSMALQDTKAFKASMVTQANQSSFKEQPHISLSKVHEFSTRGSHQGGIILEGIIVLRSMNMSPQLHDVKSRHIYVRGNHALGWPPWSLCISIYIQSGCDIIFGVKHQVLSKFKFDKIVNRTLLRKKLTWRFDFTNRPL